MRITLTVNGRVVVASSANGFDVEKFTGVRLNIFRAASYWSGVFGEAKKDFELVAGLVKKYKGMAKDFTGEVKSLATDVKMCWEPMQEVKDTQHPTRLMILNIVNNFEAVFKDHVNDFNIGNNAVMLDQLFEGGAFRSIDLSIELSAEEEEEFGIPKWKLLALRFYKGIHITKVRKGGIYVYGLNLDMICPGMNFVALLYGHPELLAIIAPIAACYNKEIEEAVNFFNQSWNAIKNPVPAIAKAE